MPKIIKEQEVVGKRFGRWTVLRKAVNDRYHTFFVCECECGTVREVDYRSLKNNTSKGCGCIHSTSRHNNSRRGKISREYSIWAGIKRRCNNPNAKHYDDYGGRGIKICDRWADFQNFLSDMGECPDKYTIEREEVNGNYEPNNCIWASRQAQSRNKRTTVKMVYNGVLTNLKEISERTGFSYYKLYNLKVRKQMPDADVIRSMQQM